MPIPPPRQHTHREAIRMLAARAHRGLRASLLKPVRPGQASGCVGEITAQVATNDPVRLPTSLSCQVAGCIREERRFQA